MAESTLWWLLAGGLIALELLTGTFYLLMLSLGVAGAAIAAHLGASVTVQLVVAAVLGGGFWPLFRRGVFCLLRGHAQRSAIPLQL